MLVDLLLEGAGEIFTAGEAGSLQAVLAVSEGIIQYIGPLPLPKGLLLDERTERVDLGGRLLTPGLVEAHTHIIFAGDRSAEYAMRAAGGSYLKIAAAGGGIAATMQATRRASEAELFELALPRLARLASFGVTTAEIKSGYGLSTAAELKMLRVIRALNDAQPLDLVPTFLGAHTIPPELRSARGRLRYLEELIQEMLPQVAEERLAEFCDIFIEEGAFSLKEAEQVLSAGLDHGLKPKAHVDQLSSGGGAELAADLGAVSADHLDRCSPEGIYALAQAGTTAVLLPGAALFLDENARAPARALLDAGVPVALSTDCNPGSCMSENLLLMLTLGMSQLKMSPREVLEAVTIHAARAINRQERAGVLAPGRSADLAIFSVPSHKHLPYHFGVNHCWRVYKRGKQVQFG